MRKTAAFATPSLFILVLMISVGPFGDTIYAPSLPSIAEAFNTRYHNVQLTITFYLFGYSISQILYGPFSDRFGRKPIMIVGGIILLIGSTVCLISHNISVLIFARFLQGFGACAGAVISSAAVRDAFSLKNQGKVFAKMNAAFSIAPGAGAIVGTFISWQTNFIVLFVLAIILLISIIWIFPETLRHKNYGATRPKKFFLNYCQLFRARGYFIYLCLLGLNIGMVYSCLVEAPSIVINTFHLQKIWFIVIAGGIVIAFMIGSVLCTYLVHKISQNGILLIGMIISFIGSFMLLAFMLLNIVHLYSLLTPVIILFTGISFVIPIATAKAMAPFTLTAGSASAMMGFFQMGVASLITAIVTILPLSDILSLPVTFMFLSSLSFIILLIYMLWLRKSHQFQFF